MHLRRLIPLRVRDALRPVRRAFWPDRQTFIGYVRQRSPGAVSGWLHDPHAPTRRLAYEAVVLEAAGARVLATGVADRFDPELVGLGDARYGFHAVFPPVPSGTRVEIRPLGFTRMVQDANPDVTGYVRELSPKHVAGWLRENGPQGRVLTYSVESAGQVLATGMADGTDAVLSAAGLGNAACGFRAEFATRLTANQLNSLVVRCVETGLVLEHALDYTPRLLGYLRERSTVHVAGWMMDKSQPDEALAFDVVCTLPGRQRVVGTGVADQYDRILFALGEKNPASGFRLFFDEPLTEAERDHLEVRAQGAKHALPQDPNLVSTWQPVRYIAMDIVDNCNLRCPFCLFDHAPVHKTNVMTDEVFAAALRWLPYVGPEGHWMSCLHEPTMHPRLTEFITRIPDDYRHVMTYTTNLTRRMPDKYFAALADSGLSNINVSIESRDPAIYERMRKGGKFHIFMENWDKLLAAFAKGKAPPPLRYIAMAYKSNYREIPELIEYLRNERNAWKIEIRDTYDVAHIPQEFRDAEYLERHEWQWLKDALASYSPIEVSLSLPPDFDQISEASEVAAVLPVASTPVATPQNEAQAKKSAWVEGLIEARILHDGQMIITTSPAGNYPNQGVELARMNVVDIEDPGAFILSLRG